MSVRPSTLRELHELHQRAKALRDRVVSGPKTIAAREQILNARKTAVEAARKALQDAKVKSKSKETQVQSIQNKIDDLKVKLNAVKKNEEYKAIQNQIAHDKANIEKIEDEILESMTQIESQGKDLEKLEAEFDAFAAELDALKAQVASQAETQKAQLQKLESAIVEAESVIPDDERDRYRRNVKQRGADALAQVENSACGGCYVTITAQALNDMINGHGLSYCKTCGRLLYLSEEETRARR